MDFQLTCGANNSHKYIYLSSSTGIYFQMGGVLDCPGEVGHTTGNASIR